MTDFENFQQFGRIRNIAKSVDPYSMTFESSNELYVALSSKQVVAAEKFKHMSDNVVKHWLKLLLNIRGIAI